MAKGVNKVILIGNLGNDPETRNFPDGGAITNASLATSESWKDKQTGQPQERTEWHKIVFADRGQFKLGQIAGQYLRKGSKVYVEGKLRTRKWQDKAGVDHYTTEVVAEQMQMLDPRQDGQPPQQYQQPQQQARQYAPSQGQPAQQPGPPPGGFPDFEDDIPF